MTHMAAQEPVELRHGVLRRSVPVRVESYPLADQARLKGRGCRGLAKGRGDIACVTAS